MTGMAEDYKTSKEEFVSGQTGSTVAHINLLSSVALASIALHSALRSRFPGNKSPNLFVEYFLLIVPLLLSMTIFANESVFLDTILLFPMALILFLIPQKSYQALPSSRTNSQPPSPVLEPRRDATDSDPSKKLATTITPLPALTTYRAHMLVMTFLAILAVDFPIFPRYFAKCETFGVSLMDMGVGSFVFSQGIVSAIPLLKNPKILSSPVRPKVVSVSKKMIPLIVLGVLRVISVKASDYPEHVSEYGVHWNFFLTLAALPPLQVLLHPLLLYVPMLSLGLGITFLHQFMLSNTSLQTWTLNAPRTNLLNQNKEGIVSIPGYLAIHVLGLLTGTVLLPSSPSDFRRIQQHIRREHKTDNIPATGFIESQVRQDGKTAIELCSYAVLWWALFGLCSILGVGGGVSRRLANLSYVLWVTAYNTSFVTGYLVLDIVFFPRPSPRKRITPSSSERLTPVSKSSNDTYFPELPPQPKSPLLFEAINRNGLALFLLTNLATGIINLAVQTMYASDTKAMSILSLYAFGFSAVAWVMRDKRFWKF